MGRRLAFALAGALGCLLAALLMEWGFAKAGTAQQLDDHVTRLLLFRSDIARRLEQAGAKQGDIEITLAWDNTNDLDLWCVEPSGEKIFYRHMQSRTGGELDVDANSGSKPYQNDPVEHIYWPRDRAPIGRYRVYVDFFAPHGGALGRTPFRVEVSEKGRVTEFDDSLAYGESPKRIYEFAIQPGERRIDERRPAFWRAEAVATLWTAGIACGFALLVALLQNGLYRRRYDKPMLSAAQVARIVLWGSAAGAAAGALGQALYSVPTMHRTIGWLLLGGLLGYGLSLRMPNLPRQAATLAGLFGGAVAGGAFGFVLTHATDAQGRLLGAALLGFCIGLMVSLVLAPREPEPEPLPLAELEPMGLRSYRSGPIGTLRRPH